MTGPLLYQDLASLWPFFSPPEEYVEEVDTFRRRFMRHGLPDGASVLHLGSGGGSIDHHLQRWYRVTGVDLSEAMIGEARRLNPGIEYVRGDIRSARLERTFDAVLVHDAISYMTSVRDLEAAYRTAAAHLSPNGLMLALPEETRERLAATKPSAEVRTTPGGSITILETHHDADPADHVYETVYLFLIREEGERLRVELSRHLNGVFELEEFLDAIRKAGFSPDAERWELSEWGDGPEMPLIVATREG